MRLIDADSLLKMLDLREGGQHTSALKNLITNAPTVQREGWVSVPTKLPYDDMRKVIVDYFDRATKGESFLFDDFWLDLIKAAPKLNEVKP